MKDTRHKKNMINLFFKTLLLVSLGAMFNACQVSLSGSSIPPEVKTISITNLTNESGSMPAQLGQQLAESFRNYYLQNTSLKIVPSGGDYQLTGRVIAYEQTGIAPTSDNKAASNRLTIKLSMTFVNTKNDKESFKDQVFSQFCDFEQTKSLSQEEANLIQCITPKLELDLFNKTVANW